MDGLIGRDDEFAAIGAALRRPDLAGILLSGDAGVGKSHLLGAAMRHAEETGFATVQITGTSALTDIPLAAFSALLPGRPTGDAGDLVILRRIMQQRSGGRPLLLGVDDAHLLDEASAALVHQLASDLTAFVVGTVRSGEAPPDAISALLKDGLVQRLGIEPLQRAAMAGLAEHTLGRCISLAAEDQLWERTLGNPLFARELLLGAVESGALVTKDERLELTGEFSAPQTLTELVESRLNGLSDLHQRAVSLIGVGGPLEIDLLERLVDPDALVHLEEVRILAADEVERTLLVRFVHPAYAEVARKRIGRLLARQLLRELADGLEALPQRRPDDVLRIATWRLDGGSGADPGLVLDAARMATKRNDFALAERLASHALDSTPSLRAAMYVTNAFIEQGQYDEARAVLHDERIDRTSGTASDRQRIAWLDATIEFWGRGDRAAALDALDRALELQPEAAAFLNSIRGVVESSAGFPTAALEAVPPRSPSAALPLGAYTMSMALWTLGRPQEAIDLLGGMPTFGGMQGIALVQVAYVEALVEAGRITDARDAAIEGWERAVRDGDVHGRVAWSIAMAWVDWTMGRRTSAQRWFAEAADLARRSVATVYGVTWALGGVLLCAAEAGDLATARATLARLEALPPHDAVINAYLGFRGRAWLQAAQGDVDAAVATLIGLADEAWRHQRIAPWLRIVTDIARLDRPEIAAALLESHPVEVDGTYLPALIRAVRTMAANDAVGLMEAAEEMTAIGALALGAEAAAGAWAIAREQGLDARLVAQYGRRAQELRESIDTYSTPAFTSGPPEVSLSRREREIALLVAGGRTSREVADELIIGVRTVESHLARVYSKLGVRSRAELADALGLMGVA